MGKPSPQQRGETGLALHREKISGCDAARENGLGHGARAGAELKHAGGRSRRDFGGDRLCQFSARRRQRTNGERLGNEAAEELDFVLGVRHREQMYQYCIRFPIGVDSDQ